MNLVTINNRGKTIDKLSGEGLIIKKKEYDSYVLPSEEWELFCLFYI
jgi:hypothetical protein